MRRRLDLASSLMTHPRLIILDEPTTGLDPITRNEMWNTIRQLVNEGSTVLLTTLYLEEADQLADHIAIIRNGKVMAQGTPDDLKNLIGDTHLEIRYDNKHQMRDAQRIIHLQHISRSSESDTLILNMKESTEKIGRSSVHTGIVAPQHRHPASSASPKSKPQSHHRTDHDTQPDHHTDEGYDHAGQTLTAQAQTQSAVIVMRLELIHASGSAKISYKASSNRHNFVRWKPACSIDSSHCQSPAWRR